MKKILCLCFFLSSFFVEAQTTVILTLDSAGEDATINSWPWASYNPGTVPIYVSAANVGPDPPVTIERSFFKFDLTSIPSNSIVLNAKLSLYYPDTTIYCCDWSIGNSNESVLELVTSPWTESTISWSNQPIATTAGQVILPESTSQFQDYPNINVSTMVQQMVSNPSLNFGFFLHLILETYSANLIFASGDNPDSTKHPKLEITYMPVGIEENSFSNEINLSPNPATTEVTINFSRAASYKVQLCNTLGEILEQTQTNTTTLSLNMSSYTKGIYLITVTDETGNKTVRKIVKM